MVSVVVAVGGAVAVAVVFVGAGVVVVVVVVGGGAVGAVAVGGADGVVFAVGIKKSMNRTRIETLRNRAFFAAIRRRCSEQDAKEFAQECALRFIMRPRSKQTVDQCLTDVIRERFGCDRTRKPTKPTKFAELKPKHAVINPPELFEVPKLDPLSTALLTLYCVYDFEMAELGRVFGRTEGWISQQFKMIRELANQ